MLSQAELQVVSQLSRGRTSTEATAEALHVSAHTIRNQLASVSAKTGIQNRNPTRPVGGAEGAGPGDRVGSPAGRVNLPRTVQPLVE